MSDYLFVDRVKIHTVRLGINLNDHGSEKAGAHDSFVIGYLARICPEKGLHILIDAFKHLKHNMAVRDVKLKIAGYLSKKDEPYFSSLMDKVRQWHLDNDIEYLGEIERSEKIRFLGELAVLSVPTVYREPKGLFVLEALANGVPVVQPAHGAFPELIEETGGGILVTPESAVDLAEGINSLINDPEQRKRMATRGKEVVHQSYGAARMAQDTLEVYNKYVNRTV
jgi:glycosyltransferase involved in cell wall biosynthesis